MYLKALVIGFVLAYTSAAVATEPSVVLHCAGKSWPPQFHPNEVLTDAIVRIDEQGSYIEISAVGSGQSPNKPRMVTSAESVGSITLRSASEGKPPFEAWFNLNKYTGELIVSPPSGQGGKIFFMGSCKAAKPLF